MKLKLTAATKVHIFIFTDQKSLIFFSCSIVDLLKRTSIDAVNSVNECFFHHAAAFFY